MSVSKDEEVHLHAIHTDTSISYNLKTRAPRIEIGQYDFCARDSQLILSPERVAIYGDNEWRLSMLAAVKNAVISLSLSHARTHTHILESSFYRVQIPNNAEYRKLQRKVSSFCVVADDSVFLTILIAHLSKTTHVLSLFPGLREKGAQYLQAVSNANGFSMDRVKVLEKMKTSLLIHDTHQKKVDLLIGEPFYYGNDGMLPWQNLRFWKERTTIDSILSKDVLIMPCKGILKACAMSLPDLWKSRCSLNKIEGFDHSVVNATLGASGDLPAPEGGPCLPFSVWQCGDIKELSQIFTIMEFDFSKPISPCSGKAKVEFTEPGICHGIVLWIDWVMDAENSIVLSTGPDHRYRKQGVKLLAKPMAVRLHGSRSIGEYCSMVIEASFDPSSGELIIKHAFA